MALHAPRMGGLRSAAADLSRSRSAPSCLGRRPAVACGAVTKRRRGTGGDEEYDNKAARRRALLKYVREVQPGEIEPWIEQAPPKVVSAMKLTVNNLVGTLPPQHFSVTIDTVAESLVTLMDTMLRTGYLMRGAQYQLELEQALLGAAAAMATSPASPSPSPLSSLDSHNNNNNLRAPAAPDRTFLPEIVSGGAAVAAGGVAGGATVGGTGAGGAAGAGAGTGAGLVRVWQHPEEHYAPGIQLSRVEGEVMRWHPENGLERVSAQDYIQSLHDQVLGLQMQLQQQQQAGGAPAAASAAPGFAAAYGPNQAAAPLGMIRPVGVTVGSEAMASSGNPAMAAAAATAAVAAVAGCTIASGSVPDLLEYIRGLDGSSLASLGACGQDVAEAMNYFMERLMGASTGDKEQLRSMTSSFDVVELSKLLFWLLVVGWSLRSLEVKWDVEQGFGTSPSTAMSGDKDQTGNNGWFLPGW